MKIGHGFTERIATPPPPPPATGKVEATRLSETTQTTSATGDSLQLSGFAARLNNGLDADILNRANHVNGIASAIASGTFVIDAAAVSRSIVSEGLQSSR